jgi:hypothetical protein
MPPDTAMSFEAFPDEGAVLRHHQHVTRAVHHDGLVPVLRVALAAWWTRPRPPHGLSARLRADMGFPPERRSVFWPEPSDNPQVPLPMWWRAM